MRQFKFRAWDGNKMNYKVCINHEGKAINYGYRATDWLEDANAGIPMQYTGVSDCKGKDIYEGDIIAFYTDAEVKDGNIVEKRSLQIKPVIWFEGAFYVSEDDDISIGKWINSETEVIGNIHENPELIK